MPTVDANFETVDENCNWILQVVKCTRLAQRLGVDKEKVCRLSTLSKSSGRDRFESYAHSLKHFLLV